MAQEVVETVSPRLGGAPKAGIKLANGFEIETVKMAIWNQVELESHPGPLPFPEMFYGNNYLSLSYRGKPVVAFNACDALAAVAVGEGADKTKVAIAKAWTESSLASHAGINNVVKPYDWTYSTTYSGTAGSHLAWKDSDLEIDIAKLSRPDPILFYDEIMLYEDELGDNGSAVLNVRVRVMPTCFLILQRFFLRVDKVLIRTIDTRLYHDFTSDVLIREYLEKEMPFDAVMQTMPC
ncbi:hypothetical protein HDV03_004128 [Kappamyces sp. JEL0829]|nr:hypothetical protein HDV03_004128 [Kappamyces sp. JEL0829]